MNSSEKLNLKNLIKEYKYESTTDKIRELKHSEKIRLDIVNIIQLKNKYTRIDSKLLRTMIEKQCMFLYKNYTNIFNKIVNDTIDLNLLHNFLNILKSIEDGNCDQHEASFKVGQILKKIYIDSAVREADKNDKRFKKSEKPVKKPKKISWSTYKNKIDLKTQMNQNVKQTL
tara:strand:- start:780 stop:1295 length:516 start_codon:yes stop_codon:yes gene_type:complete